MQASWNVDQVAKRPLPPLASDLWTCQSGPCSLAHGPRLMTRVLQYYSSVNLGQIVAVVYTCYTSPPHYLLG